MPRGVRIALMAADEVYDALPSVDLNTILTSRETPPGATRLNAATVALPAGAT